jgi:ATP-dependent Lon protease
MAEGEEKVISPEREPDSEELKIPEVLPLLAVRDVVVFPYMIITLFVGREVSIRSVD